MPTITCQLKYCERCGALRLRSADSAETYCPACGQVLFHWSLPEPTRRLLLRWPPPGRNAGPLPPTRQFEPSCGRKPAGEIPSPHPPARDPIAPGGCHG